MAMLREILAKVTGGGDDRIAGAELEAGNARLRTMVADLTREAAEQAERIANLRARAESMALDQAAFTLGQYLLCKTLFGPPNPCVVPPREIPPSLRDHFTMGGLAAVELNYLDATYPDNWPLVYTDFEIDYYLKRISRRQHYVYGMVDAWLWEAIAKYPIKGLSVVNIGSLTPWYEANCLFHGASSTTIDYNKIITLSDRIKTMTVADWDREQPTFDVAWSISSFEHDGLGMYGDPLDPDGDIKAMAKMKRIVKPEGLLFLAVPVGKDKILFNNARIYGKVRLERLFQGWEKIDSVGFTPSHLDGPGHIQPLFILRNT
jgi:hypothetical protein